MQLRTRILGSLLIGILLLAPLSLAGPGGGAGGDKPDKPPKPRRLGTPAHVTCTRLGDQLTLAWDAVTGAMQYRVYLEIEDGAELVDTVPLPPYTHAVSDMTDDPTDEIKGHVRAIGSRMGKDASKPSRPVTCE
jgi:hypothetical protein